MAFIGLMDLDSVCSFFLSALMNDLCPFLSVTLSGQLYTPYPWQQECPANLSWWALSIFFKLGQIRFGFSWGIQLPRLKSNYFLLVYIPSWLPHLFACTFTFLFQFRAQSQVVLENRDRFWIYEIEMSPSFCFWNIEDCRMMKRDVLYK